jgi:hypothetical protein
MTAAGEPGAPHNRTHGYSAGRPVMTTALAAGRAVSPPPSELIDRVGSRPPTAPLPVQVALPRIVAGGGVPHRIIGLRCGPVAAGV